MTSARLFFRALVTGIALAATCSGFSAQVQPADYEQLSREAAAKGYARVLIALDVSAPEANRAKLAASKAVMEKKEASLLAELGPCVLQTGYWSNGMGQIGVYVSPAGLELLRSSVNAVSFMRDVTRDGRGRPYEFEDGRRGS